jgi:hypothetical protein
MMFSDKRNTLWRDVESELEKNADSIDPDYIDRRINELCELETQRSGLCPPEAGETQINNVITRIISRVHKKTPVRRLHPLIRIAIAACIAVFFIILSYFSSNYVYAKVTNHCFLKKTGIALCCGTVYCPCSSKKEQSGS